MKLEMSKMFTDSIAIACKLVVKKHTLHKHFLSFWNKNFFLWKNLLEMEGRGEVARVTKSKEQAIIRWATVF